MKLNYIKDTRYYTLMEEGPLSFYSNISSELLGSYDSNDVEIRIFEKERLVSFVRTKSWGVSGNLTTSNDWETPVENYSPKTDYLHCVDPRVLMIQIFTGRISLLASWANKDQAKLEEELNEKLETPTKDESIEWLEKNHFHWHKLIDDIHKDKVHDLYGWSIADQSKDFVFVPQNLQELYDQYYCFWKEAESKNLDEGE